MTQFVCPECGTAFEGEVIEGGAGQRCSSCGTECPPTDRRVSEDSLADQRDVGFNETADPVLARPLAALPKESSIRVVESSDDRLVLFIPGGGKRSGGLGFFALVWNGFMTLFTALMVGALLNPGAQPQQKAPPAMAFLFISVFWLAGLVIAYAWLRMKYLRTFLLLDRERIVLQEILFGRRKLKETTLTPESRAELVESYQQNNVSVYRIEVVGSNGTARFGTSLSDPEKDWVVDRVNEFLGVSIPADTALAARMGQLIYPEECDECDAPLSGQAVDGVLTCAKCGARHEGWTDPADEITLLGSTSPNDELADQTLRVVESSDERLVLELKRHPASATGFVTYLVAIPIAIAVFCGISYTIFRLFVGGGGVFGVISIVPALAVGLVVGFMILYAFYGRTEIELNRDRLRCQWIAGPLRYWRTIRTPAITSVRVENLSQSPQTRRRPIRTQPVGPGTYTCVVRSSGKMIPLTFLQTNSCSLEVEKLIHGKLTEWDLLPKHD